MAKQHMELYHAERIICEVEGKAIFVEVGTRTQNRAHNHCSSMDSV